MILSSKEILYIAVVMDATSFMGIADAFYGMEESEIRKEAWDIQKLLVQKGYAQMNFEGEFTLEEEVIRLMRICAFCDIYVYNNKILAFGGEVEQMFYVEGNQIVQLKKCHQGYECIEIFNLQEIYTHISKNMEWKSEINLEKEVYWINKDVLIKAKEACNNFDVALGAELLKAQGMNEKVAHSIYEGLVGVANYYCVVTINLKEEEKVCGQMFIDSQNGIFQLKVADEEMKGMVQVVPLSKIEAENIIRERLNQAFEKREECFA